MSNAVQFGEAAGQDAAIRARAGGATYAVQAAAVREALEAGRASLRADGVPAADIEAWGHAFLRGAEGPLISAQRMETLSPEELEGDTFETWASVDEAATMRRVADEHGVPAAEHYRILIGMRGGETHLVPHILSGSFGLDGDTIDANVEAAHSTWLASLTEAEARTSAVAWLGARAVAERAKTALLITLKMRECEAMVARAIGVDRTLRPDEPARRFGYEAGRATAQRVIDRARQDPNLRPFIVDALQSAVEEGAKQGRVEGLGEAAVAVWQSGFMEGADPIMRGFLREWEAETPQPVPFLPLASPAPISPPPRRRLRPEDFGCLPVPR